MDDSPGSRRTIGLDDPQQQTLHRREWRAERIGWALVTAAIVAGLCGLLGPGWLSHREKSSPGGGISAEYFAAIRYEAPAELRLRFAIPPGSNGELHLALSRSLGDAVTAEAISPPPAAVAMDAENLTYIFHAADMGGDGRVVMRFKPNQYGWLNYTVSLGGETISISQFVLP
jgi:hypothetical protein